MPKHKPIKFETTLEPTLKKELGRIMAKGTKARSVMNVTLAIIAIGGILTIGTMAPGLIGEIARMQKRRKKESYEEYKRIWHNFRVLKQQRELEFVREKNGYLVYRPTKKGKEKIKKLIFNELKIKNPEKWDGNWRLVIFDVPESYRKARGGLRRKLKDLGFYQCQKSAWIYPFPCVEEIEFLKEQLNIKPFVKLFLVNEMTDGKVLYNFRKLLKEIIVKK